MKVIRSKKQKPEVNLNPGHSVMLNQYNYEVFLKLARELDCTVDQALNYALASVEFEVNDNISCNKSTQNRRTK